jgi:hypothetical protein
MAYTSHWEALAHALRRIIQSGIAKSDAMKQLAYAIADREVAVRVAIDVSARDMGGEVLSGGNLEVPERLSAEDFDWHVSRPTSGWATGPNLPQSYFATWDWSVRPIAAIEVYTADIDRLWCSPSDQSASLTNRKAEAKLNQASRASSKASRLAPVAGTADEVGTGPKSEPVTQRGSPRQRLRDALLALQRSGNDIKQMHRGELHKLVLDKTSIKDFGSSRSTFDRALADALGVIGAG